MAKTKQAQENKTLVQELSALIKNGSAHAGLDDILKGIPEKKRGIVPQGLPYSIWQIAEHIRIAQWDMLEFSRDPKHKSPKWPDEYWPMEAAPKSSTDWQQCLKSIKSDRKEFIDLINDKEADLHTSFEWGSGQTLLKEALQLADHNAYHAAEILVIRRLLGIWE
jgi:hypothetical protein